MVKEKKSVAFSTRFTESMDKALEELSDVKMLTKHDIVRIAISEYLLNNKCLIDKNIEYKKDKSKIRYDDFDLITTSCTNTENNGTWIVGVNFDDNEAPDDFVELVKVEVNIPLIKEREKIPALINQLQNASDLEKKELQSKLMELMESQFLEEYTLKYTDAGLKIKDDPRFQQYVHEEISKIVKETRNIKK